MIERITKPEDFEKVLDSFSDHIELLENNDQAHCFVKHDIESIKINYSNKYLLAWDVLVWANKTNGKYDALIIFMADKSIKFGVKMFSEFLWLSQNPSVGYKLLKEAVKYARQQKFDFISMSVVENHPKSNKVKKFYKNMGFVKDCETHVAKL